MANLTLALEDALLYDARRVAFERDMSLTEMISGYLKDAVKGWQLGRKAKAQLKVVEISSSLVLRAIQIKDECQLSYCDALIIAAAEAASCETVWSEDLNDGQVYGEVTVRNPFAAG